MFDKKPTKSELIKMLDKHTQHQEAANMISSDIYNWLLENRPDSELICELGCLSVTEPRSYKSLVLEEFGYKEKNDD